MSKKSGQFSLRITIGTFISILLLLIGCLVLTVIWVDSRRTLLEFSDELAGQVASTTREQVRGFLATPEAIVEQTRSQAINGALNVDSIDALEASFFSILQTQPRIGMVGWGNEGGSFTMVKRQPDGSLATKILTRDLEGRVRTVWRDRLPGASRFDYTIRNEPEDLYDPRSRPWYTWWKETSRKDEIYWTDVYVFHADQRPGITASLPWVDNTGKLRGVFAADVSLSDLCDFLADLRIGTSGQAMILDTGERLVATRKAEDLVEMKEDASGASLPVLRILANSTDPVVAALAASRGYSSALGLGFEDTARFVYSEAGRRHLATLVPVKAGSRHWVIGVTVPEDDFLSDVKETMRNAAWMVAGLILLAILIGLKFTKILAQYMQELVADSERIRRLDFSVGTVTGSPFKEIDDVLKANENMKTGLRSFGKYVPKKLVNQMLTRNIEPELGGDIRPLTILFSDIRQFTAISEEMGPKLAEKLGGYFNAVTEIFENDFEGTVDKYVGDSVVAFWGAPEPVVDHARKACHAVFKAIAAINAHQEEWEGTIPFFTCFGVHTDDVTVGHFGSSERLDYTCIGDGVNLASRLEQINKYYGTQVIISESTQKMVMDEFECRCLDLVAVKGKTRGVYLYELLGPKGQVDSEKITRANKYEEGFRLYLDRRFSESVAVFEELLAEDPQDTAVDQLLRRVQLYERNAPPADWAGVHVMESK